MKTEFGFAGQFADEIAAALKEMRATSAPLVSVAGKPGLYLMNNAEADKAVKEGAFKLWPVRGDEILWLVQK